MELLRFYHLLGSSGRVDPSELTVRRVVRPGFYHAVHQKWQVVVRSFLGSLRTSNPKTQPALFSWLAARMLRLTVFTRSFSTTIRAGMSRSWRATTADTDALRFRGVSTGHLLARAPMGIEHNLVCLHPTAGAKCRIGNRTLGCRKSGRLWRSQSLCGDTIARVGATFQRLWRTGVEGLP